MPHTVSAVFGIGAFLLAMAAAGEAWGYLPQALLDNLAPNALGFLVGILVATAVGAYLIEERTAPRFYGRRKGGF